MKRKILKLILIPISLLVLLIIAEQMLDSFRFFSANIKEIQN